MLTSNQVPVLLNESNWSEVLSSIGTFPFRISEIRKIHKDLALQQVSFKYNLQGKETYISHGQCVTLHPDEYLLSTNHTNCEVIIDEQHQDDQGLCVDMNIQWLQEGMQLLYDPSASLDNAACDAFLLQEAFFNKFQSNPGFSSFLNQLFHNVKSRNVLSMEQMGMQFMFSFLMHHKEYLAYYRKVPVRRKNVKTELFNRMLNARNMLHDLRYSAVSIQDVAAAVFLSPYRFFHLFKETFGISPYQYVLQLKLNEAVSLYRTGRYSWTEIAEMLYFSDVQSFSKCFKKVFHQSPKTYLRDDTASHALSASGGE